MIRVHEKFKKKLGIKITNNPYKSFIKIPTEKETIRLFFNAYKNNLEISKYFSKAARFDIKLIESLINKTFQYKYIKEIKKSDNPHGFIKNSVLLINENSINNILHLYLVKEPDVYSTWKIILMEFE